MTITNTTHVRTIFSQTSENRVNIQVSERNTGRYRGLVTIESIITEPDVEFLKEKVDIYLGAVSQMPMHEAYRHIEVMRQHIAQKLFDFLLQNQYITPQDATCRVYSELVLCAGSQHRDYFGAGCTGADVGHVKNPVESPSSDVKRILTECRRHQRQCTFLSSIFTEDLNMPDALKILFRLYLVLSLSPGRLIAASCIDGSLKQWVYEGNRKKDGHEKDECDPF